MFSKHVLILPPKKYVWINEFKEFTMGFTHFGVVEFVGNTLASYFFAEVGMNIFCSLERLSEGFFW